MPSNAYYIVEEFLRSDDVQARKNALTALALLEDDTSVERLARAAVRDPDDGVRNRALDELASLPDDALPYALRILDVELAHENKQRAFAALGHLKSLGKQVGFRSGFFFGSSGTWGMNSFLYPVRNFSYRIRALKPSLIGGAVFTALLSPFYATQARWDTTETLIYAVLIAVLAVPTSLAATQRTTPINLYLNRKKAFFVETLSSLLFTLPLSLLLLFIARGSSDHLLYLALSLPLTVGVVRAATILSFGVFRGRMNTAFQVCAAVAAVFLILAAFNFQTWLEDPTVTAATRVGGYEFPPDPDSPINVQYEHEVQRGYVVLQTLWICLMSVAFAAACAFASIDKKSPPVRPVAGRAGVAFSVLAVWFSLLLLIAVLMVGRTNPAPAVNLNATFDWWGK